MFKKRQVAVLALVGLALLAAVGLVVRRGLDQAGEIAIEVGSARRTGEPASEPPLIDQESVADEKIYALIEETVALVREDPGDAGRWMQLGEVYQTHQIFEQALICYDTALSLDEVSPRTRYLRAIVLFNLGEIPAAIADMEQIAASDEDYLPVLWRLGYFYLEQGDADEALVYFRQVLAENPGDEASVIGAARCLLDLDQPEDAVRLLEALLNRQLDNAPYVNFLLGTAYQRTGQPEKARVALASSSSEGLRLRDPWLDRLLLRRPGYFGNLESVTKLLDGNNPDLAITVLDQMVVNYPGDETVLGNLGYAWYLKGDYDKSIDYGKQALEISPDWTFGLQHLAQAYSAKAGSLEGEESDRYLALAESAIDRALELNPNQPATLSLKAGVFEQRGDYDTAIGLYRRAFEGVDPGKQLESVGWLLSIARLEGAKEDWDAALTTLERVNEIRPQDAEVLARIAVASFNLGDEDRARTAALSAAEHMKADQESVIVDLRHLGELLGIDWAAEGAAMETESAAP
jgi:tetratricopeptide (TPR) repeat protein